MILMLCFWRDADVKSHCYQKEVLRKALLYVLLLSGHETPAAGRTQQKQRRGALRKIHSSSPRV